MGGARPTPVRRSWSIIPLSRPRPNVYSPFPPSDAVCSCCFLTALRARGRVPFRLAPFGGSVTRRACRSALCIRHLASARTAFPPQRDPRLTRAPPVAPPRAPRPPHAPRPLHPPPGTPHAPWGAASGQRLALGPSGARPEAMSPVQPRRWAPMLQTRCPASATGAALQLCRRTAGGLGAVGRLGLDADVGVPRVCHVSAVRPRVGRPRRAAGYTRAAVRRGRYSTVPRVGRLGRRAGSEPSTNPPNTDTLASASAYACVEG